MHKVSVVYAVFEEGELTKILQQKNLTWEEFSDLTDFPIDMVRGLVNGKRGLTLENARFVAYVLNLPFDELFGNVFAD